MNVLLLPDKVYIRNFNLCVMYLPPHEDHKYMSGGQDVGDEVPDRSTSLNETNSELSNWSHLDAPNDSVYMIGGVLIAMLLVAVIIVLLAVTISKLRKREDGQHLNDVFVHPTSTPPDVTDGLPVTNLYHYTGSSLGLYTPPFPMHPQRRASYQETQQSVYPLPSERPGFCRGFRKNLRGRWRRLVKGKNNPEVFTIPPDCRNQLKQMYVY